MPPMCTPDKMQATTETKPGNDAGNTNYDPGSLSLSDCSLLGSEEDESDDEVREKMEDLLQQFPELETMFNMHGQVGVGTFSTVYVGSVKGQSDDKRFAIKHVVPTCHPDRIKFELKCLKEIGGSDNVSGIALCLRHLNNVIFVMPYQPHYMFSEYVGEMDTKEIATYMKNLLIALRRVHSFGVIHRDVKPSNFLYDRLNKKFLLVDFGLAQKQPQLYTDLVNNDGVKSTVRSSSTGSSNSKRKRDPMSPLIGVTQDPKRGALLKQHKHTIQSPTQLNFLPHSSSQKENNPNACNTPRTGNEEDPKEPRPPTKSTITYVKYDHSPELKSLKGSGDCLCYGRPTICSACPLGNPMQASRAGTPGFRPPEVLLKFPHQTTAVDIWAAGVILLSILSNCNNFFSCTNDISALLELVSIFGQENIKKLASTLGRFFISSEKPQPIDLRKMCCTLRNRGDKLTQHLTGDKCKDCKQYSKVCLCPNIPMSEFIKDPFPTEAYHLLGRLLDINPRTRITADEALNHPFFDDV